MRVTMLLDNIAADPRLAAEHGLSLYIETEKHRILFDAGQSDAFARNAEALGIDLSAVDIAFVSHGHYDHTGGIARFLELNDHAPVYVHKEAFGQHVHKDGRTIGMPAGLAGNPRLVLTDGNLSIDDELSLNSFNGEENTETVYMAFGNSNNKKTAETSVPTVIGSMFAYGAMAISGVAGMGLGMCIMSLIKRKKES